MLKMRNLFLNRRLSYKLYCLVIYIRLLNNLMFNIIWKKKNVLHLEENPNISYVYVHKFTCFCVLTIAHACVI